MLCPYLIKTEKIIETWKQTPDENGAIKSGTTVKNISYEYRECVMRSCGAYHDGKCNYNNKD